MTTTVDERVPPERGGCWYCYKGTGDFLFSWEFDTFIHLQCILDRIDKGIRHDDFELLIFIREFDIKVSRKNFK